MCMSLDGLRRLNRFLFTIGLALAWANPSPMAQRAEAADRTTPAASNTPAETAEEAAQSLLSAADQLDRNCRALAAIEREIPRETFDSAAILAKVGRDPTKLFEWVRDNTFWVPYQGALRGPVGVLMDRLGNSLDRSLLLAELLRSSGFKVRLLHCTLPEEQAKALLAKVRPVPREWRPQLDAASAQELEKSLPRHATEQGLELAQLQTAMRQQVVRTEKLAEDLALQVAEQTPALAKAFPSPVAQRDTAADLAALRDHWWVQFDQGGRSVEMDVLLGDSAAGQAIATATERLPLNPSPGKLPLEAKYCHELTIRVLIEQCKAGKLSESTVLKHTIRPAEVVGQPITLSHVALDYRGDLEPGKGNDPTTSVKAEALRQAHWLPTLMVGSESIVQLGFTAEGDVIDKPTMDPAKLLGQGTGKVVGGLGGMLGGGDEPAENDGQLSAAWIEYELHVPGQPQQTLRRELLDLVGPAARLAGKVPDRDFSQAQKLDRGLAFFGQVQILPQVCGLSSPFVDAVMVRSMLANQAPLAEILRGAANNPSGVQDPSMKLQIFASELYALAIARSQLSPARSDFYVDRPNILSFHRGLAAGRQSAVVEFRAFDIVCNDVAAVPGRAVDAFRLRLEQGVFETVAESLLLDGSLPTRNCAALFAASAAKGQAWTVLRTPQDMAQAKLGLSADQKARLATELKAGYAVMAPAKALEVGGSEGFGWWRIDPRTGQSLGMGPRGWGDAAAEKAALDAQIAAWKFRYAVASGVVCVTFARKSLRGTACCILGTALSVTLAGIATSLATVHVGGVGGISVALCSKL